MPGTLSVPVLLPPALGANVTWMVQLPDGASDAVQVVEAIA